ncbi:ABC transporter permease [Virgibacillus chiguensis]|uniref:Putative hemin transport system permease protein HrtB n=1 Tax=Virgibacillus chiguensis TaxID=411959 RepID=A0A1M5SV30_9BACI|nr:ABC transporter permease [Virgibacillus chiguensis]SHH42385.1 putative ABC transport system permease protein [Virgibacillus chiguensis]
MFLAWNEMKNNKLRFTLIVGVLLLVSYLVFLLSGLANGLEDMNKAAVDKWEAQGVILTEESDVNLPQSSLSLEDYDGEGADEFASLAQISSIATSGDNKSNVALFGIHADEFIMPDITEGETFQNDNEVVADASLKEEGFELGDELQLASTEEKLTIVGFTDNAKFIAAPVLYTDLQTVHKVRYGEAAEMYKEQINAFVIRTDDLSNVDVKEALEVVDTTTFIENLPGYSEQKLTLNFMIYFLFVISAVVLAIFLYVLTIQKISIFGVMKAQGISSKYLANSVIAQTFLLAAAGVVLGFLLTMVTGFFLPDIVPIAFNYLDLLLYGIVLVFVSVLGALFSIQTIVKIDPLKAIGG